MDSIITLDELCNNIKEEKGYTTIRACIYEINRMINDKKIYKISPKIYMVGNKDTFSLNRRKINEDIINELVNKYDINFVLWDISVLNNWLNHLINSTAMILEVEKDYIDFVFDFLKEKYNVLKNPTLNELSDYLSNNTIILKPLISKSPINNKDKSPKIEKIIVDIFSDRIINYFYEGKEIVNMLEEIFSKYAINYKTMFAYAKRRSVLDELKQFLTNNSICEKYCLCEYFA